MIIKQLSVFIENESGRLTEVTEILGDNGINISALSLADTKEFGILRLVVSDPSRAIDILKQKEFSVRLTDVICLVTPHQSGALANALHIISKEGISVEYMYAFANNGKAFVVMKIDDAQKAVTVLQKNEQELLSPEEIYQI